MQRMLALMLVATAMAGCASEEPAPDAAPQELPPTPTAHDLAAAARDALADGAPDVNLRKLANFPAGGEEADAWGDYLFLDRGSNIDIVHMDVADGNVSFSEVSSFTATGPKDVKVSDDGNFLFLGNDEQLSGAPLDAVRAGGFYVYDVSDKAAPTFVSKLGVGQLRGPHMVFYHQQPDGTELVLGANADVSINRFDRETGTLTELSRYAPNPVTDVNRDPQVIDAYYQLYTHDMFVMEDPVGKTLLYTASWDAGVHIVDITDPSNPVKLGAWNDFGGDETGNLHTVATEWIGDRRITVGSVEVGFAIVGGIPFLTGTERSVLYVWDTTDLANPTLLGTWENPEGIGPGGTPTDSEVRSTHNLQLEDGRIYMAHYGLGVWVLDVSTPENQAAPQILAFDRAGGNLWDTIVHQGVVLTSGSAGLTGYHFPLDVLGPTGISSRA